MKEWLSKFAEDRALGKNDLELGLNVLRLPTLSHFFSSTLPLSIST